MTQPVAAYYPDFTHQVPWGADPNDPQAARTYADVTAMVRSIDRMPRGRQYELAQTRVEESMITFRDPDEKLNPVNPSSAFYPYVQPYRELCSQAVWPKGPGSGSNLLNLNNWRVPADGSFESYTVGTTPDFLTSYATSAAAPTVTTTNPQAGTKSLTYDVPTSSANRYGIEYYAPCVPGTQYTTSAYVRQTSASTQIIRISDQVLANDTFNRTTASGFGTAAAPLAAGGLWSPIGGAAGARSTVPATPYSSAYAQTALAVVNTNYWETLPVSTRDVRCRVRLTVPVIATGGEIQAGLVSRWTFPGSDTYEAVLIFSTAQTVQLRVGKRVATVFTSLGTYDLQGVYYQPGDEFYLDFQVTGSLLRAAAWRVGAPAVDLTTDAQVSTTDTSISGAGAVGLFSWLHASNTNTLPVAIRWHNYSAVGSVEGSSTATTGSYVRLSVTYTATATRHAVTVLTTQGTAVAGTVNVDSIMHNTGASAGTFASTGSTIYPLSSRFVERWPRSYEQAGFVGITKAPAVDALAALAAISLPSDYDHEVMRLSPDFYYPLTGGENSTLYPDVTGNNNPPLGLNISKYGIGTLPAGGAAMSIPGGAGATGVTFTPPNPASGNTLAATVLGLGRLSESPQQPFVIPKSLTGINGVWRLTVAAWVRAQDNGVGQSVFYPSKQVSSTAGMAFVPLYMNADGSFVYSNVSATGTLHLLSSGTGLSGIDPLDGEPHLLVGITVQDTAGDTVIYRYIDDVLDGVNSATTASLGGPLRGQTDSLSVGATDDGASFLAVVNGAVSRLAIWNRELSPTETGRLWSAGQGWVGETALQRVERHFVSGGFTGSRRIGYGDFNPLTAGDGAPLTTMQAPSWTGAISLLADTQNTVQAELGTMWAAADGYVTVEGRAARYLRLTPDWTLGEDTAAGEIPYLGTIGFDFDPTFVYGDVAITRPGGATAVGGLAPDIATTNRRYFPRAYGASVDVETDQQAQDYADWVFYSHRAPNMRVETVTVNPAANPSLWHFALSVEIGQRIRVKRRAKAGNGGAGLTLSLDYFVENVTPRGLDFDRGTYFVDLELSPVGTGPGPTVQPWILEDPTLSVLDSTTVLGF